MKMKLRLPRPRVLIAAIIAVAAIAGLIWQHYDQQPDAGTPSPPAASVSTPAQTPGSTFEQLAPPTVSMDANSAADAKAVVTRFATNFGSPNGNHDDWLARLTPDVSVQLIEQFRLTDIRNVTQAAVAVVDGPVRQEPASMTFERHLRRRLTDRGPRGDRPSRVESSQRAAAELQRPAGPLG